MSGESDDSTGEKELDATPQKLEKARKKGDIAKSNDISVAAAYLGLLLAFLVVGTLSITKAADGLTIFLASPDLLSDKILAPGGILLSASILGRVVGAMLPIFALPFLAVILSVFAQRAFIFAPSKLAPKLNRISPISGAKNKFGISGLVEFGKTFIKMLAVALTVGFYIRGKLDEIAGLARATPVSLIGTMFEVLMDLLILICIFAILVGIADLLWQKFDHARKQRMSLQEMKDENKESEGDPHSKAKRRQRGREIATNRMLLEVPKADVVVVNPTHYAVALKWSRKPGTAPICVAKGEDEIAARIREIAHESGVPVHSDPPTARAIHATIKVGHEIASEQYKAIAAALRFADIMRKKARERGGA
ncbi:MAG: flagellar type III secretion system protein FlhB [Paracoccaceae bacterium]